MVLPEHPLSRRAPSQIAYHNGDLQCEYTSHLQESAFYAMHPRSYTPRTRPPRDPGSVYCVLGLASVPASWSILLTFEQPTQVPTPSRRNSSFKALVRNTGKALFSYSTTVWTRPTPGPPCQGRLQTHTARHDTVGNLESRCACTGRTPHPPFSVELTWVPVPMGICASLTAPLHKRERAGAYHPPHATYSIRSTHLLPGGVVAVADI
jgi:hypothetical protein